MSEKVVFWHEEKRINPPQFKPGVHHFGLCHESDGRLTASDFFHCRDTFHRYNADADIILFSVKPEEGLRVAEFMYKFEVKMDHTKLTRIGPTSLNTLIWVEPAEFWWRNTLRRSLFTALLRAGTHYTPEEDNFDALLTSAKYLKGTKKAVEWFLSGRTWTTSTVDPQIGWCDAMRNVKSEARLKAMLTCKPVSDKKLMDYALKLLGKDKEQLAAEYRKVRPTKSAEAVQAEVARIANLDNSGQLS